MNSFLAPPTLIKPLESSTDVVEKTQLTLEVTCSGIPTPVATWIKDKTTLNENDRI